MSRRSTHPLLSALSLAAVAALVGAVTGAGPATAAPPSRETIHEDFDTVLDDYCGVAGLSVRNVGTFDSRLKVRTAADGTDYYLEHISVRSTLTGVDSGRSVTIRTDYVAKDLKISVAGTATTFVALLTGPSTVHGPDGRAIARDPGQTRLEVVYDDQGTPDEADDTEVVTTVKPSTGRSDDYCAAIVPVVG